jgi:hypothetical protein
MNSKIISLFKLHINKYYGTALGLAGVMLVLMLITVSVQVYSNNQPIDFGIRGFGPMFSLLALVVFARGKNGEGKFLSRLPVSKFQVFFTKLVIGVLIFISVIALFLSGAAVVSGLLKLAGYHVAFDRLFDIATLGKIFVHFFKGYLWYMFLVCLVLFLERWMSAGEAVGLIIVVPILLMMFFPLVFKMLNINIDFDNLNYDFIKSAFQFVKANKNIMTIVFYAVLTVVSSFLFRLRRFKSF